MKNLKTAVIGLGRIGWSFHIPNILSHDGFTLTAVVDVSQERLDEAKSTYQVNGYTEISQMLKQESPDLVVVASPTHLHMEHACAALRAGCDVFLDKPMAKNLASARAIAQCAVETGQKLMIYQPHRVFAEPNLLKEIISSGKLGKIYMIKRAASGYSRRNDWQAFRKYGGGMLNNYGAHYIDQLLYITGEKVSRLHCVAYKIASAGDADDVVKILLETENHVLLDLDINMATALPVTPWMLFGQFGTVAYEKGSDGKDYFKLRYYDPKGVEAAVASEALAAVNRSYNNDVPLPWVEERIAITDEYKIDFYQQCYAFFAEGKKPFVPVDETLYVMELIDRCHTDSKV